MIQYVEPFLQYIFICLADAVAAFICSGKSLRRKLTADGSAIVSLVMYYAAAGVVIYLIIIFHLLY